MGDTIVLSQERGKKKRYSVTMMTSVKITCKKTSTGFISHYVFGLFPCLPFSAD